MRLYIHHCYDEGGQDRSVAGDGGILGPVAAQVELLSKGETYRPDTTSEDRRRNYRRTACRTILNPHHLYHHYMGGYILVETP